MCFTSNVLSCPLLFNCIALSSCPSCKILESKIPGSGVQVAKYRFSSKATKGLLFMKTMKCVIFQNRNWLLRACLSSTCIQTLDQVRTPKVQTDLCDAALEVCQAAMRESRQLRNGRDNGGEKQIIGRGRETSKDKCFPYERASRASDLTSSSVNSLLRSCQQEVPLQHAALSIKVLPQYSEGTGAVILASLPSHTESQGAPPSPTPCHPDTESQNRGDYLLPPPPAHPPLLPLSSLQLILCATLHVFQRLLS